MKYDWDRIEHEYVTGKSSMAEMAKKHKIPEDTFYKRAEVRNFQQKRENYANRVRERALMRAQAREARTLNNLNGALDKAARMLSRYIADEDTLHGRVQMGESGPVEYRTNKLDTKALRDMTAALREAAAAMRLLRPDAGQEDTDGGAGVIILPMRDGE